jgi:hypothetical protein
MNIPADSCVFVSQLIFCNPSYEESVPEDNRAAL